MAVIPLIYTVREDGDTSLVSVRVVNNDTVKATGITVVFDAFPTGVTLTSTSKEVGTYTTLSRTWAIDELAVEEAQVMYMLFTVSDVLLAPFSIVGVITNAENAEYPGEAETSFEATIDHEYNNEGTDTDFENTTLVSFYSAAGAQAVNVEDAGVLFVLDTTLGDITMNLPTLASVGTGKIFKFKHLIAGGNDAIIEGSGAETVDVAANVTLTEGQTLEIVSYNVNPNNRWIVTHLG